ncbi:MAG: ABC transporter permease, partial [Gemmatimonadota bacterium]
MSGDPSRTGFPGHGVWPSRLEWMLARRYLTTRSQSRFLNLITWIAVGGVALGVAALLLVVGVMTGMQREIRKTILGTYPHVMVMTYGEDLLMQDWGPALEAARRDPAVVEANPFVYSQGLVTAGGHFAQAVDIRGLATDTSGEILEALRARVLAGELDLSATDDLPPAALGYRLADRLIA